MYDVAVIGAGVVGENISTLDELKFTFEKAFLVNGSCVIDCAIDMDEFVLPIFPPGGFIDDKIVNIE